MTRARLRLCLRLAAVAFSKKCFRSLPHYCEGRAKLKKRAGVQQKKNRGIGQKQKFESSKAGCSKRIAYFCTCRLALRPGNVLGSLFPMVNFGSELMFFSVYEMRGDRVAINEQGGIHQKYNPKIG